jgi:hydroxyethylthiazole kinase-like sugar kinase family protein
MCRLAMSDEEKNLKNIKKISFAIFVRVGILMKKGIERRKAKLIK